jgi:hypothetical protein
VARHAEASSRPAADCAAAEAASAAAACCRADSSRSRPAARAAAAATAAGEAGGGETAGSPSSPSSSGRAVGRGGRRPPPPPPGPPPLPGQADEDGRRARGPSARPARTGAARRTSPGRGGSGRDRRPPSALRDTQDPAWHAKEAVKVRARGGGAGVATGWCRAPHDISGRRAPSFPRKKKRNVTARPATPHTHGSHAPALGRQRPIRLKPGRGTTRMPAGAGTRRDDDGCPAAAPSPQPGSHQPDGPTPACEVARACMRGLSRGHGGVTVWARREGARARSFFREKKNW